MQHNNRPDWRFKLNQSTAFGRIPSIYNNKDTPCVSIIIHSHCCLQSTHHPSHIWKQPKLVLILINWNKKLLFRKCSSNAACTSAFTGLSQAFVQQNPRSTLDSRLRFSPLLFLIHDKWAWDFHLNYLANVQTFQDNFYQLSCCSCILPSAGSSKKHTSIFLLNP